MFVAETDPAQPPLILRDPRVAWALSALPPRFTREAALASWAGVLGGDAAVAFDALAREGVLVRGVDGEHDDWAADGWREAALFHHATRDYPFLPMDEPGAWAADAARMERYIAAGRPPPPAVDQGDRPRVGLARFPEEGWDAHLETLTVERRRGVDGIGLLLDVCCGIRRELDFGDQGTFFGKAVPSGGARHPTEAFVAAFDVDGLEPGVYHYAPLEHALARVAVGDRADAWRHATFDLFERSTTRPLAVVALALLWERAMWRYRDDRSARAPFIDLGHVVHVLREVAGALGFEVRSYHKARDREVAELCGVDPCRLTPLFVATLS